MQEAILYRNITDNQGTEGYMVVEDGYWNSLELPDRDNQSNISCIPEGEYNVVRRYSPHFKKELYHLEDVLNRSFILIHSANFAGDIKKGYQSHLQGCIALGKATGAIPNKFGKRQKAILSSKKAIREFEEYMERKPFKLTIKDIVC